MAIVRMATDEWSGNRLVTHSEEQPTWERVAEAIERLDAKERTEVFLQTGPQNNMVISGGSGQYVVSVGMENDRFLCLQDPTRSSDETVELLTSGQLGRYRADRVVGLDAALTAARAYVETAEPHDGLPWVET